jgi:hypothetical protein
MNLSDIKLYTINSLALGVTMMNIEVWLKVILLIVTIGYTLSKWINIKKDGR